MSIIEFIIGLLILVASLLASTFCYFVKNEKSGVNNPRLKSRACGNTSL